MPELADCPCAHWAADSRLGRPDHHHPACDGTGHRTDRPLGGASAMRATALCDRPPAGWHCTLDAGHDGPCPTVEDERAAFPHCDTRVLHGPKDGCDYCNSYPDWQGLRTMWGIAFTGHKPTDDQLPCPADAARPKGSPSDHRQWAGNRPQGYTSAASMMSPDAARVRRRLPRWLGGHVD